MYLDINDLKAMKLFNDKAEKLNNNSFTKKIISDGFGITISAKKGGPVNVEKRFPTDESIDAFILTLRFFIQDNEASSFRNLTRIYSKLPDYRKEKSEFLNARKQLNDYLNSSDESLKINENGKLLTNKEIFKTVLLSMKSDVGVGSPASSSSVPPESPPVVASSPHSEAKPATKAPSDGPMSLEDMKNFVEQKIIATNKGKGVKLETLGNPCKGAGMTLMQLEAALKGLMDEGRIYEPKVGLVTSSGA